MKLKKITRAILTTISYFCFISNSLFCLLFCVCMFQHSEFLISNVVRIKTVIFQCFYAFYFLVFLGIRFVSSSLSLCEGIILSLILYAQKYMMSGVGAFEIFGLLRLYASKQTNLLFWWVKQRMKKNKCHVFSIFVVWNANARFRKPASMQCQTDRFVVIVVK